MKYVLPAFEGHLNIPEQALSRCLKLRGMFPSLQYVFSLEISFH